MADDEIWGWHGLCFRAMNTNVEIQLYTNSTSHALDDIQRMFHKAESCLTRFEPTSELCKLNRSPGRPLRVSPLLLDAVEMALWAAAATDGLFDPTLLHLMKAIGYDRSFEQIERVDRAVPLLPPPQHKTYQKIRLDRVRREICLPPDAALDLGGIGKGWTVDRAADWLVGAGPFMINAGGDLYAYASPPGRAGWSIGIVNPLEPGQDIARLQVRQRAVATSTISRRQWRRGDRLMHHLIDPRTGQPAETEVVSVTVIAHRVAVAEVFAKTALILGAEAGLNWLNGMAGIEGLLVQNDGQLIFTDGFSAYLEVTNDKSNTNQTQPTAAARLGSPWHRRRQRHRERPVSARARVGQRITSRHQPVE
jgi:thiamine biosynthesis lipoprotein